MEKLSLITLAVSNLERSLHFYEVVLELKRVPFESNSIAFFDLGAASLALYSKTALAEDAGVIPEGQGFSGITLAHNVNTSEEILEILQRAITTGGTLVKPVQAVFGGGFSGYFADPDGYIWEIACSSELYVKELSTIFLELGV